MTEEVKLKKRIAQEIIVATMESNEAEAQEKITGVEVIKDYQTWALIYADKIITLVLEAGYKSPEEYRQALWDRNLSNRDKMMGWDK